MKKWQAFHQILQKEIDPLLKDYDFELVETTSNAEGAERMYALPDGRGAIIIDVIQRIRVDENLHSVDIYWLKIEGGIRASDHDNLLPLAVIPDRTNSLSVVDSEKFMTERGWLYQNSDELQAIVDEVKTKFQSALKSHNKT